MKETILRNAIKRYITENHEDLGIWSDFDSKEMMGAARREAMQDIESSGADFVDLGKSNFEKDLDIEEMLRDLEAAKHVNKGAELQKIQKQINHLKRFGAGSLNEEKEEESFDFDTTNLYKFLKDAMHKFESLGLDYAQSAEKLEKELNKHFDVKNKNINEGVFDNGEYIIYADDIENLMDKDKVYTNNEFINVFTQNHALPHSKVSNGVKEELKKRGFHFAETTQEGIGTGLEIQKGTNVKEQLTDEGDSLSFTNQKGMNVKPTYKS